MTRWFDFLSKLQTNIQSLLRSGIRVDQYDVYRFLMLSALEIYHSLILNDSSKVKEKKRSHYERLCAKIIVTNKIFKADEYQRDNSSSQWQIRSIIEELLGKFIIGSMRLLLNTVNLVTSMTQ